jgi:hypothetical protein
MIAIGHFMVGFSIILIIATLTNSKSKFTLPTAFLGGLWALIPDLVWLRSTPYKYIPVLQRLHDNSIANLFFLHRLLDLHYPYDVPDDAIMYIFLALILTINYSIRIQNPNSN